MARFNPWVIFGLWRVFYLALVVFAINLWPQIFGSNYYDGNFKFPPIMNPEFMRYFNTWDGNHYFFLAERGYSAAKNTSTAAFYPLWPKIWSLANLVAPQFSVLIGVFLSNIFSWLGIVYFYKFVEKRYTQNVAMLASILCLSNITAFYFCFPYTESLFFFLSALVLWNLQNKNLLAASGVLFLLPLCRATGIYSLLPLVYWFFSNENKSAKNLSGKNIILLLSPILGYFCYFLFMYITTSDPFEGVKAQRFYISHGSVLRLFDIGSFVQAFLQFNHVHSFLDSALDRVYFLMFLLGLVLIILKREWLLLCWALPSGLLPALLNHFFSYMRFFQLIFPIYIILAIYTNRPQRRYVFWLFVFFQFALQILMLLRHINNYWVG